MKALTKKLTQYDPNAAYTIVAMDPDMIHFYRCAIVANHIYTHESGMTRKSRRTQEAVQQLLDSCNDPTSREFLIDSNDLPELRAWCGVNRKMGLTPHIDHGALCSCRDRDNNQPKETV